MSWFCICNDVGKQLGSSGASRFEGIRPAKRVRLLMDNLLQTEGDAGTSPATSEGKKADGKRERHAEFISGSRNRYVDSETPSSQNCFDGQRSLE